MEQVIPEKVIDEIYLACETDNLVLLISWQCRGVDLTNDYFNICNHTQLMIACSNGSKHIVKYFIKLGINTNTKNKYGLNALMMSCTSGNYKCVKLLLDNNALINDVDYEGKTALIMVVEANYSNKETLELLLKDKNIDINIKDNDGFSAMMYAVKLDKIAYIELLGTHGAKFDMKNKDMIKSLASKLVLEHFFN